MGTEFASHPESRMILPKSTVEALPRGFCQFLRGGAGWMGRTRIFAGCGGATIPASSSMLELMALVALNTVNRRAENLG